MQTIWAFAARWAIDPIFLGVLVFATLAYLAGVWWWNRRVGSGAWPRWRTATYLSGVAAIAVVLLGPFGAFDDTFFWAHMVQHMVLMMLAAPLLLIGSPGLLALRAVPPAARRRWVVPVIRSRVAMALTHPVVTWLLLAGTLLGTHFSPFYDYAITHEPVHRFVEHPLYLSVALLYFAPLLGRNPLPRRLPPLVKVVSLVAMMAPETMTGFFLFIGRHVYYPSYATVARPFGPGPLFDQQLGGAIMWGGGMILSALWIVVAVRQWLRAEERATRRSDRLLLAAVAGASPRSGPAVVGPG